MLIIVHWRPRFSRARSGHTFDEGSSGDAATATGVPPRGPHEEIDPLCAITVDVATARYRTVLDGRTIYFCSAGCLERFTADPAAFRLEAPAS